MGGGDLNSKKSWHPNTIKNQERVWKAEQAAAEEKKRIQELQHERAAERDRAELNDLAKRSAGGADGDSRLHWMYDKPDKKVHHEDYLLGKAIEKSYDQPEKSDDVIPAVARRIVGSSMMTSTEDSQVDLVRKMREDPLLLVKERERAARAALLNNPIHRKRITALLRKEQEEKKEKKQKKPKKNDNLDNVLAAKLSALGGDKGLDIAALLASDSSSSSDSDKEECKKKKKKKKKVEQKKVMKTKKKKKVKDIDSDSSDNDKASKLKKKARDIKDLKRNNVSRAAYPESEKKHKHKSPEKYIRQDRENRDTFRETRKQKSESFCSDREIKNKQNRRDSSGDRRPRDDSQRDVRRRSQSDDSNKQIKTKRNRKDSFGDRKQRDISRKDDRKRSESYDSDRYTKNYKHSGQNSNERRHYKADADYCSRRRESSGDRRDEVKSRRRSADWNRGTDEHEPRRRSPEHRTSREDAKCKGKRNVLSEAERAAKLAEMAAAGVEREVQRGLRVAAQLAGHDEDRAPRQPRAMHNEARALPDSLESRIHSNRHYIQRDKRHMNEHFARR